MSVDMNGRDLSKPIPPMDVVDWEGMQIEAEASMIGGRKSLAETDEQIIEKLAKIIFKMSSEIRRLRLTYGEEVWEPVYRSKEQDDEFRKTHEATREGKNAGVA